MSLLYVHGWCSQCCTLLSNCTSPSLSLGFWMLNWEKYTKNSCLQHNFVKCSSLEVFINDCISKSPRILKTYCWVGLGFPNSDLIGFGWGLGMVLNKNLIWWFSPTAMVQSTPPEGRCTNSQTAGIEVSGIALISAISETGLFNTLCFLLCILLLQVLHSNI